MLPTFIVGLREGLEAALIVGIVAAFLGQQGRRDAIRLVWLGTAAAVLICVAVGVGLDVLSRDLPQKQQEGLETVIGLVAVTFVTSMVLWMRRHARDLKRDLEGHARSALEAGSSRSLVLMAFLAVVREGFETVVFLLATFQNSPSKVAGGIGAVLGILVAAGVGYGIYRGGVKINLARFFKVTGVVLVLVAAGLVLSAAHTANEAGWLSVGQQQVFDLTWLVRPGTPVSALVTGVLGIQQFPVRVEVVGYVLYLVPMLVVVLAPSRRRSRSREPVRADPPAAQVVPTA